MKQTLSLLLKRCVNRGFLRGPFLPLYGSGAVILLLVSSPFKYNIILVYLSGVIGATILEYITGVTMEALLKVRYWDYSKQPFNYKGYVCLFTSLAWGGLTVLMTKFIHHPVEKLALSIPDGILTLLTLCVTIWIAGDFALSFRSAFDLRELLSKVEQAREELAIIQQRIDTIVTSADLGKRFQELLQTKRQLLDYRSSEKRKILRGNPSITSKKFNHALEELKNRINQKNS